MDEAIALLHFKDQTAKSPLAAQDRRSLDRYSVAVGIKFARPYKAV